MFECKIAVIVAQRMWPFFVTFLYI
jgi:hypothetical protein